MSISKILRRPLHIIYFDWFLDIRAGGPVGYLANLRHGLDRLPNSDQLSIWMYVREKSLEYTRPRGLYNNALTDVLKSNKWANYLISNHISRARKGRYTNFVNFLENIDSAIISTDDVEFIKRNEISSIHCHHHIEVIKIINALRREGLNGVKVVFTPHQPEAPSMELYDEFRCNGYSHERAAKIRDACRIVERRAFTEPDILVFPSVEATEPYNETIPEFDDLLSGKDVRYVQTGVKELNSSLTAEAAKEKYGVTGKTVFVYIGRHNGVKGYDVLCEVGGRFLRKHSDAIFLIGGKRGALIKEPRHGNWRELGWVDPADLLKAADAFILPNRRTYFDLVLLEALSTGIPVIASATGGNKTVAAKTPAVMTYDGKAKGLEEALEAFISLPLEERARLGKEARKAYLQQYTSTRFAADYCRLVEEIHRDYGIAAKGIS